MARSSEELSISGEYCLNESFGESITDRFNDSKQALHQCQVRWLLFFPKIRGHRLPRCARNFLFLMYSITYVLTIAARVNTELDIRFVRHNRVNRQLPQSRARILYVPISEIPLGQRALSLYI